MTKYSRTLALAITAAATLALPGMAQAGSHRDDCFHKAFRDVDRAMTRAVGHVDRSLTRMFRWCDRK